MANSTLRYLHSVLVLIVFLDTHAILVIDLEHQTSCTTGQWCHHLIREVNDDEVKYTG